MPVDEQLADIMRQVREMDRAAEAAAAGQPAQQPAQQQQPVQPPVQPPAQPPADNPDAGHGETLEALETRLRAAHDDRVRAANFEAQRPANEEILRRALGSAYRPLPSPDSPPPTTRRDGTPLTALDVQIAAQMRREFPFIDFDGSRRPGADRR